jgi:hypothetical protein
MKVYTKPEIKKKENEAAVVKTACTCSGCTTHISID